MFKSNLGKIDVSTKIQLIILVVIAFVMNINTLFNEYAFDDIAVITQNQFVQKGIKGIPEILTTDYFAGYAKKDNTLSGVRYRPISLLIFALEYHFFGATPFVSHLINILLFALLVGFLFKVLQTIVFKKQNNYLAFLSCIFFIVHPIHTEVIANIKGRDELLTFLFLLLSLTSFISYIERKSILKLAVSLFCFLLSLLTKETALIFLGVIPLLLYFFKNQSIKKSLAYTIPFFITFIGYMVLRYNIVGLNYYSVRDITNSPYIYATASEAFATKVYVLIKYVWLLFSPFTLSYDYSYNQIPYINLLSWQFVFSFICLTGLAFITLIGFKKKLILSFCILYFFITVSVGSNFIFDLGTIMAERILFQPSLAFCVGLAILVHWLHKQKAILSYILTSVIVLSFSFKTISRNAEWKNNETLFLTDVKSAPNSSRTNLYACEQLIIKSNKENDIVKMNELLDQAIIYGEKSLQIHSKFAYTNLRLSIAYYYRGNYAKSLELVLAAQKLEPGDEDTKTWSGVLSDNFYKEATNYLDQTNINAAKDLYLKSIQVNKNNIDAWYNLGGCYFILNDTINGTKAWHQVSILDPNHRFNKNKFRQ